MALDEWFLIGFPDPNPKPVYRAIGVPSDWHFIFPLSRFPTESSSVFCNNCVGARTIITSRNTQTAFQRNTSSFQSTFGTKFIPISKNVRFAKYGFDFRAQNNVRAGRSDTMETPDRRFLKIKDESFKKKNSTNYTVSRGSSDAK